MEPKNEEHMKDKRTECGADNAGEYLLVLDTCRQVSKMLPKMQLSAFAGKNVEEKAEKGKN